MLYCLYLLCDPVLVFFLYFFSVFRFIYSSFQSGSVGFFLSMSKPVDCTYIVLLK